MDTFNYFPTNAFTNKLDKIKKQDPLGHNRILKVIDRLLANPGDADGKMHGAYHGRMKKYVGRKDYRLIYHWCEECRKENRRREEKCGLCEVVTNHSVIFFDVYHKNEITHLKNKF